MNEWMTFLAAVLTVLSSSARLASDSVFLTVALYFLQSCGRYSERKKRSYELSSEDFLFCNA